MLRSHVRAESITSVSVGFGWGEASSSRVPRVDSVASVKCWGIFNISRSNTSVNRMTATQLEPANEIRRQAAYFQQDS